MKPEFIIPVCMIALHLCLLGLNFASHRSTGLTVAFGVNIGGLLFNICRIVYLLRAAPKPQQSELERVIYGGRK